VKEVTAAYLQLSVIKKREEVVYTYFEYEGTKFYIFFHPSHI